MDENIYRTARKTAAKKNPLLNNCESAQDIIGIERTRIIAIENGQKDPAPGEVVAMAEAYDAPELRNYYCTKQCPIGCDEPTLIYDNLDRIFVELMSALHTLDSANDKLYKVFEDGVISDNEKKEFAQILGALQKISYSSDSLKLWAEKNGFCD